MRIVEAVQDRYDGYKRNPFEHNESGVHYARALSSWSVLLALSGVQYDGVREEFVLAPKINPSAVRSFWSSNTAWGEFSINPLETEIKVLHGTLSLKKISVQRPGSSQYKVWEYKKGKTVSEGEVLRLSFKE